MRRSPLFRLGVAVLAAALCVTGTANPAHADPDTGTVTGRLTDHTGAQWAHGKRTEATATPVTVVVDQITTVDEKLVESGTVAGRFTDRQGKAIAYAAIDVSPAEQDHEHGEHSSGAMTDRKGRYKVTGVPPGKYRVSFTDRTGRTQYAYGKGERETARVFTVESGKTTTVNDKLVPAATLRITAVDAKTGKKLTNFCVFVPNVAEGAGCTKKSVVVLKNLPAATLDVDVRPASKTSLYLRVWDVKARTTAGKTKNVTIKLQLGGAIKRTVVDRATGRAVKGACFAMVVPGDGVPPINSGDCTDAKGRSRTGALAPGTYNVFIDPPGKHGTQWLGKSGGTGDQRAAAKITVKAGKVANAPKAKLDKAGSITGTVTGPDGQPVTHGTAGISAWHHRVSGWYDSILDGHGRYALDGLGPYRWPLVFTTDHGRQWSGGKGNRFAATTVQVTAGKTVTHDEAIRQQSQLTGTVTLRAGSLDQGLLMAHSASTGDPAGDVWFHADGTYTMRVPGGEKVKIEYGLDPGPGDWLHGWYGGKSFATATVVDVPASGAKPLDITVG